MLKISCFKRLCKDNIFKNKVNRVFFVLAGLFLTNALVAEFIGVKIFSFEESMGFEAFNWTILGVEGLGLQSDRWRAYLWPIVFILTDIINEYFGHRGC